MWKLQNISVTQTLRETNFGEFRSSKSAIFVVILGPLNFVDLVNLNLQKLQKIMKIEIQNFETVESQKLISRKI